MGRMGSRGRERGRQNTRARRQEREEEGAKGEDNVGLSWRF